MTKQESLSKVIKNLILKESYYGLFLVSLNKRWSKSVPTAAVGKNGINQELIINEDFWSKLSEDHRLGLLKHETLHICFAHIFMSDEYADKKLFNIAADIEVNQYISGEYLPDGAIQLNSFPGIDLPYKAGTRKYYEILSANKDNPTLQNLLSAMNKDEDKSSDGLMNPHHDWSEFDELGESEKKLMQSQAAHTMKNIAEQIQKSRGTVPGEIKSILDALDFSEPPKFDWRGYLRRFAGSSMKVYTKKLRRKENKRFTANPGLKIKQKKHILVAVDVSGSVSDDELVDFFHEIDHIFKTGSEVTVIQCDTAIKSIKPYKKSGTQIEINGRGGTSFDPVIDYYDANKKKYTSLVYLTDGEAPAPNKPKGKMLWVLSSVSNLNPELPGQQIKLN